MELQKLGHVEGEFACTLRFYCVGPKAEEAELQQNFLKGQNYDAEGFAHFDVFEDFLANALRLEKVHLLFKVLPLL